MQKFELFLVFYLSLKIKKKIVRQALENNFF